MWASWSWPGKAFIGLPCVAIIISAIGSCGWAGGFSIINFSGLSTLADVNTALYTSFILKVPGVACDAIWKINCDWANLWALDGIFGSDTGRISTRPSKSCFLICAWPPTTS